MITAVVQEQKPEKNIELKFNEADDTLRFTDIHFADFSHGMIDRGEEMPTNDLLRSVFEIMGGSAAIIDCNGPNKKEARLRRL